MPNTITTLAELEALYGEPSEASTVKEVGCVTPHYRAYIEASPFAVLATAGPEGLDCSPRGDKPGFVRIHDERTLMLPDRRGNNRIDSLRNIVRDPRVALLFLIPGPRQHASRERTCPFERRSFPSRVLRDRGKGATLGHGDGGREDLFPMRPGAGAVRIVGPGTACRSQDIADNGADPGGLEPRPGRRRDLRSRMGRPRGQDDVVAAQAAARGVDWALIDSSASMKRMQ